MSRANKRPSPRLGDTADALEKFVAVGRVTEESPSSAPVTAAVEKPARTARRASSRPDGNMHGRPDTDADDMAVIRAAREARERPPERTVKTTIRLPEDIATELRIVAIREGVTMAEITTGILRAWMSRYQQGEL